MAPGDLDGGLAEPEELQPAEGSLRLVGDDDTYDAAAWEAATAAVLRKARRLGDDAPDSDVWAALTRTTLDGIDVAPIGQPSDLEGLTTSGRPARAGAWDVRTPVEVDDAKAVNEAALQDLENGATSLHCTSTRHGPRLAALRRRAARPGARRPRPPSTEQVEALAGFLEGTEDAPHPGHNLSADLQTLEMLPARVRDDDARLATCRAGRRAQFRSASRRRRRRHRAARQGSQRRPGARLGDRVRRRLPPRSSPSAGFTVDARRAA